jgi:hypothetical protein
LGYGDEIRERLSKETVKWVWPFHAGKDSIDVGGEGAFTYLFPEIAIRMAREVWERDQGRADGIVCMSARAERHLRQALPGIEIINLADEGTPETIAG